MTHYLVELALWMLVFFFAGCCIGCLLKKLFSADEPVAVAAAPAPQSLETAKLAEVPAPRKAVEPAVVAAAVHKTPAMARKEDTEPRPGKMERPKGIAAARGGKADKLQRISGIGPKNEKVLHGLGFFHFDQIAAWTAGQVDWIDNHLKFNGRIRREEWTKQAKLLAEGKEEEFTKLFGTGGLRNKQGEKQSGTRTRKS